MPKPKATARPAELAVQCPACEAELVLEEATDEWICGECGTEVKGPGPEWAEGRKAAQKPKSRKGKP